MSIKLTEKDADFILKFIRMDLRRLNEQEQRLLENENRVIENFEKYDGEDMPQMKELLFFAKEASGDVKKVLSELKQDFNRCIELLMIGSEGV